MYSHGFHLILYAVTYGAFLNFVSSYCSRLIFLMLFKGIVISCVDQ